MSDRIGDYRDPFWSARDRRIRKAHLAGIATSRRVKDLDAEIEAKRRAEYIQSCVDDVRRDKGRALAELSALIVPPKDRWTQRLESIDPTGTSALDELERLRQDVQRHRAIFRFTIPPESLERTINPVLLRLQHEEEERQDRRRSIAAQLDPVISALEDLIDSVRRYESARS
jgi:hypothetical protein